MDHLIIGCVYSREVWNILLTKLHLQETLIVQEENVLEWWLRSRKRIDKQVRRGFDSLFFLIGWTIWKERNCRLLGRRPSLVLDVVRVAIKEGEDWALAGFAPLAALHLYWSQHLFVI